MKKAIPEELTALLLRLHEENAAALKRLEEKTEAVRKIVSSLEIGDIMSEGIQNIMSYEVKK